MKSIIKILLITFFIISLTKCQPTASDSCVIYNTNYSVCTQCVPGLFLQFFFCIPCNPLCICSSDKNYCQSCLNITYDDRQLMSYRQGDICVLCNTTIPLCLQCNYNGLFCTKCMLGRYVQNGICSNITCGINCQICLDQFRCQICALGYSLDISNNSCTNYTCANNCSICLDSMNCKVCDYGFYPVNGSCISCVQNCAVCNNTQTCLICIPSYIPVNGTCQSTGLSNCVQYTGGVSSPTCLVCQPGYYNSGGSCNQCSGCLLCTQSFLCQTPCLPGFNKFNYACIQFQLYNFYNVFLFVIMGIFGLLLL